MRNIKEEILTNLSALTKEAEEIREAIALEVNAARENGASWAEIGRQLGMTKQAAQQRYSARKFTQKSRPEVPGQTAALADELEAITDDASAVDAAWEALEATKITRGFFDKADALGLAPEVKYNAENSSLTVLVTSTKSAGGWVQLHQWPGASAGRNRHYWDYASMRALAPKKVDAYTARKAIESF